MTNSYLSNLSNKLYIDLQKFVYSNNIVVTASGFAIGMVTKEVIQNILLILIIPIINKLKYLASVKMTWKYFSIPLEIFWNIALWLITIVCTFLLLEYFLNKNIFGMVSTIKHEDEDNFIKSKIEAKAINIIPNSEDTYVLNIINKDKKINEIAKEMKINNEDINSSDKLNIKNIINSELNEFFEPNFE